MDIDFEKLGKSMLENKGHLIFDKSISNLSIEEYKKRYDLNLSEQLVLLNKDLSEFDANIIELENKNRLLEIIIDKKLGKRINNEMYILNNEKIRLNETTILHLQMKKEELLKTIEKTNMYKRKLNATLPFTCQNPNP